MVKIHLPKTVKNLLKEANIEGYFTNHSCRSSTTKLFQAGVDKKLIKEITGHHSDAVDTQWYGEQVVGQKKTAKINTGHKVIK